MTPTLVHVCLNRNMSLGIVNSILWKKVCNEKLLEAICIFWLPTKPANKVLEGFFALDQSLSALFTLGSCDAAGLFC